jgi:hypothetical protein
MSSQAAQAVRVRDKLLEDIKTISDSMKAIASDDPKYAQMEQQRQSLYDKVVKLEALMAKM